MTLPALNSIPEKGLEWTLQCSKEKQPRILGASLDLRKLSLQEAQAGHPSDVSVLTSFEGILYNAESEKDAFCPGS